MARDFGGSKSTSRATSSSDSNVLGRGIRVRGRVNGAGDLRVDGEIEGDVRVSGSLELGSGASTRSVSEVRRPFD